MAARHDVWVLTRANNQSVIDAELSVRPIANLHFLYFDLPWWVRWWKLGGRGVQVYYYLWQLGAIGVARAAHRDNAFDLAHHLTFGKFWTPSAAGFVGIPFVWGPIGGGESTPVAFFGGLSPGSKVYEWTRLAARWMGVHDPWVRATARRADVAITTTPETATRLQRLVRCPIVEMPAVGLSPDELQQLNGEITRTPDTDRLTLVSVGRLLGWKGYHLAIRAFARADIGDARYVILGDGPEKVNLETLAEEVGVQRHVAILGAVPRPMVLERLSGADIFVHPSLHDSGGWATLEAMAAGLPVVCLGIGGPAVQVNDEVGRVVTPITVDQTVDDLSRAMRELAGDADLRRRLGESAKLRVASEFTWGKKVDRLTGVYEQVLKGAGND